AVEGPELVLLVDDDLALAGGRDLGGGLGLGAQTLALRGEDLELDGVDLERQIPQVVDEPVVAATGEVARLIDGEAPRELDVGEDARADGGVLELGGHGVEPLALLLEDADVLDVGEDGAVGERAAHDAADALGQLRLTRAHLEEELEERG